MKKTHLMLCVALVLPAIAQVNFVQAASINVNAPGVSVHIGDKDRHGNYWDGYDWRSPQWWREHHNQRIGERNNRGQYWHGDRWDAAPPPKHNNGGRPQPHGQGDRPDQGNGTHGINGSAPIPPTSGPHS
ncbi:DUF2502 domain-containing protein [Rouxiella sp. WC2420]|uniref:DUF2502 domain-containing protein n=1 Tax=Rouxiella sp. WC2420 TaxID=3234145 RepID=A0AB39VKW9_9GAMM